MPISSYTESSFSESLRALLNLVEYRPAISAVECERIYRMRYAAYLKEGALPPNAPVLFKDRYDDLPSGVTVGVYIDGRLSSSMRFHIIDAANQDSPVMQVFSDALRPWIDAGATIVDPTRFVADATAIRLYPKLPYLTVRLAYLACEFFGADVGLATVRVEHQAFYKRLFGHELVCPARPYPSLAKPISLMKVDFPQLRQRVAERYPFMQSSAEERRQIFGRVALQRAGSEAASFANVR